jgi:nucleotide-binding universal stress UspA family protein
LTPARAKPFAGLPARSISHCEARETGRRLYLLFVREQRFTTEQDTKRKWQEDPEASEIFANAREKAGDHQPLFCYAVSESAAETIADIAATLGASRLILGAVQVADNSQRLTNRQTRLYKEWLVTPSRR